MLRALAVWCAILVLASVNGAVRAAWLIPTLGETAGRAVSTIVLATAVVLAAWFTMAWIGPRSTGDALVVGIGWLAMTLAFEFLAGHFLFGNSWAALLDDYDLRRGRVWIIVPLAVSMAPLWAARVRRLIE